MQIDPHLLNVLLAVILGGMIGLDRQKKHQAAGLRTHMLVCVASTVLITSAISYFGEGRTEIAPIAQAIMTGIGFLGAGAIISKNAHVHGLTTAASIWCVAALGIIIGLDRKSTRLNSSHMSISYAVFCL